MLIYIEMYPRDRMLHGPSCSVSELKKRVAEIQAEADTKDFISIFCARYNFEELPLDNLPINVNIKADYYVDIDAALVHKPPLTAHDNHLFLKKNCKETFCIK